jgi:Ca2+-binding EF-hand superfamily protein
MIMFKYAGAIGVLAMLGMAGPVAADEAPSSGPGAHMKQRCKDDPDKCREAMQQKAQAWWKKVDTDGDGSISREEAQANAPRLARDFEKVDTNGDGKITREELQAAGKQARRARGKDWWQKVDADHDGSVSREEAEANAPRLAKNFDQIDADGDGKITPEELKAARKKQ